MAIKYFLFPEAIELGCTFKQPNPGDAGYDIYAGDEVLVEPFANQSVKTGLHVAIPYGYVGIIKDRSGLAFRHGLVTHAGVIDSSYRGEIKVLLSNISSDYGIRVSPGERIAQMVIVPRFSQDTERVSGLNQLGYTDRGDKGFGSSGR